MTTAAREAFIDNRQVEAWWADYADDIAFAEERRVFYVALTRTKNRIYILTPTKGAIEEEMV